MTARPSLSKALVDKGVLTAEQVEQAQTLARSRGVPLEQAAITLGADEVDVYRAAAVAVGLPFVDPRKVRLRVRPGSNSAMTKAGTSWLAINFIL